MMLRIFNQYLPNRTIFLVLFENLLILGTIQLATFIKLGNLQYSLLQNAGVASRAILIAFICQLCLYYYDLYDLRIVKDSPELFVRLLQALGVCSILVAALYLLFPPIFLGQGVFVLAVFILLGFLGAWRIVFLWVNQRRGLKQAMLILGTGELAQKLAAEVLSRPDVGIRIVGFVSDDHTVVGKSLVNPSVLGHTSQLGHIVEREKVDEVVVAMPDSRGKMPVTDLLNLKIKGISVVDVTTLYEKITGKISVDNLRPSWLIFSQGFKKSKLTCFYKRLFEIVFSTIGLIVLWPIMALIAIFIKLDSRGPVIFRQKRVGENGKIFQLLKFRSMCVDAEAKTGPVWAQENDSRVTKVGRFIRRVRFDELPQFLNVLRGDMSFVGPRPERPLFVEQLNKKIPYYSQRHTVKPGITGWAQIKYRYGSSVDDTIEKLQYDLFYVKNMSISLDLFIIFQTIKIVLQGRGAV